MNTPSRARVPHVPYSASCKPFSIDQISVFDLPWISTKRVFGLLTTLSGHSLWTLTPVSEDPGLDYPLLPIPTEATSNPVSPNEIRQRQWLALIKSSFVSRHMRQTLNTRAAGFRRDVCECGLPLRPLFIPWVIWGGASSSPDGLVLWSVISPVVRYISAPSM